MLLSELNLNNSILKNDGEFEILALSNSIVSKPALSFIDNAKFLDEINNNKNIKCILCTAEFIDSLSKHINGVLIVENPRIEYFKLHNKFCENNYYNLQSVRTCIGENCKISQHAYIDSHNVKIGNNVIIEEFVSIRGRVSIGNNVIIRSGVSIGGQGFEYKRTKDGILSVIHAGSVEIGDNVDILHNSTIHCAVYPWDKTIIGNDTKISAQVHIDHGAKIGSCLFIGAGCVVSGRTNIHNNSYIGPGCVISNKINIANSARVTLGSVVTKDVSENAVVSGNFAIEHELFIKNLKKIRG